MTNRSSLTIFIDPFQAIASIQSNRYNGMWSDHITLTLLERHIVSNRQPKSRLFVQQFTQANNSEIIKGLY